MKKLLYHILGLAVFFTSCNTIENRDELGPVLTKDQLKIAIIQNPTGSNSVVLKNETPGVIMYWDYGTGASHRAIDTIYIPFKGTFKLKYTAFCSGGTITDSTTFTIAADDQTFFDKDKAWRALTNGGTGQTWVFAIDPNNPSKNIGGNGPENCPIPAWWTMDKNGVAGQLSAPYSMADEVYMDLNGAANFVVKHADGSQSKGFFNVVTPYVNSGVSYSGIEVLGATKFPWPTSGKYHFTVMAKDSLSVHDYGAYNIALYKRKGAY